MVVYEAVNTRVSELQGISSTVYRNKNEPTSTVVNEKQTYNSYVTGDINLTSKSNKDLINLTRTLMNNNMTSTTIGHVPVKTADFPHNQIMLLILLAIFTTISVSISLAVLVFCRKKNTVFMLQKCEQESDVEMDDLPTEIDNSDTDSEEVRTVICKSESYPALSKYSRKSYPPLSKYACGNKVEIQSGSTEKRSLQSTSFMPLLRPSEITDKAKRIKCSVKRTADKNSMHKSNTFPSHHEFHSLLEKPRILRNKEFNFGSISNVDASKRTHERCTVDKGGQFKRKRKPCYYTRSIHDNNDHFKDEDDIVLTQTDSHLDFHGKLEMI